MQIRISTAISTVLVGIVCALPWASVTAMDMPERGMSKTQVERDLGRPEQTRPAVGQPPISRWVYDDFTVYFEGDYTLHAVSHHAPKPAPAVASGSATVSELPPIEEIDRTDEAETPDARPRFHFDPASGKMVELDAAGQPVTAEPAPWQAPPAEQATEAAPAAQATPESHAESPAEDTVSEPETPVDTPEAEAEEPRFRFDPATGRIVVDQSPAAPAPEQPAPQSSQPETQPEPPSETQSETPSDTQEEAAPAEESGSDSGGFFIEW